MSDSNSESSTAEKVIGGIAVAAMAPAIVVGAGLAILAAPLWLPFVILGGIASQDD